MWLSLSVFDLNNPVFFDKNLLFENHTNLRRHLLNDKRGTMKATGYINTDEYFFYLILKSKKIFAVCTQCPKGIQDSRIMSPFGLRRVWSTDGGRLRRREKLYLMTEIFLFKIFCVCLKQSAPLWWVRYWPASWNINLAFYRWFLSACHQLSSVLLSV